MSKLYFRYSCMGAGKSTNLLQVADNYESVGLEVLLVKPIFDSRDETFISSRLGVRKQADILLERHESAYDVIFSEVTKTGKDYICILVDEANFLTKEQARDLWVIATQLDIIVMTYGLRVDYMGNGFEGSKELMILAHEIEEIKTVDRTGEKCTMHLRSVNGEYVFEGVPTIVGDIKGDVRYESCTSKTWLKELQAYKQRRIQEQIDYRGGMCK